MIVLRSSIVGTAALAAVLGGTACAQETLDPVGRWEARTGDETVVLEFNPDGTGRYNEASFGWSLRGERLLATDTDGEAVDYRLAIEGDRLTLSEGDLDGPFAFVRSSAAGSEPVGIVGSWEGGDPRDPLHLVVAADGSGTLNGVAMHWTFDAGRLAITVPATGVTQGFSAALSGDRLSLSGGGLPGELAFTRAAAARDDTELVGRWHSATGALLEVRADGTAANSNGTFRYMTAGGVLYLSAGATVFSVPYSVEADRLSLGVPGVRTLTLRRLEPGEELAERRVGASRDVTINGTRLTEELVASLERSFGVRILNGAYWYDQVCGAWGLEGGPTLGFIPAGLDLGGRLRPDASGGATGVFVNGRQLHLQEVAALRRLTQVTPGRYWLDAAGNVGYEGHPVPILNLVQLSASSGGGSSHWRSGITGIGAGSSGGTSYVMGDGWSVIVGD